MSQEPLNIITKDSSCNDVILSLENQISVLTDSLQKLRAAHDNLMKNIQEIRAKNGLGVIQFDEQHLNLTEENARIVYNTEVSRTQKNIKWFKEALAQVKYHTEHYVQHDE